MATAALGASALAGGALAEAQLTRTVGKWIVACEKTEAGGSACERRNDEAGKPALEQAGLLSLTLHAGGNEAKGLVRITDLELPPRLDVEIALWRARARGRRCRPPRPPRGALHLAEVGTPEPGWRRRDPRARHRPKGGGFPASGLAEALSFADDHL